MFTAKKIRSDGEINVSRPVGYSGNDELSLGWSLATELMRQMTVDIYPSRPATRLRLPDSNLSAGKSRQV